MIKPQRVEGVSVCASFWLGFTRVVLHLESLFSRSQALEDQIRCREWLTKASELAIGHLPGYSEDESRMCRSDLITEIAHLRGLEQCYACMHQTDLPEFPLLDAAYLPLPPPGYLEEGDPLKADF